MNRTPINATQADSTTGIRIKYFLRQSVRK